MLLKNSEGEVITGAIKTTDIVKSPEEIELMRQATSIRVKARLSQDQSAKIHRALQSPLNTFCCS